jgi:hypothetical protein
LEFHRRRTRAFQEVQSARARHGWAHAKKR